jgi:hypothetical protein
MSGFLTVVGSFALVFLIVGCWGMNGHGCDGLFCRFEMGGQIKFTLICDVMLCAEYGDED